MYYILYPKQQQALALLVSPDDPTYVFYGGAAGGAKSWLGCFWIFYMCNKYAGVRYFVGRDSMKDTRESVLVTFSKMCKHYGFVGWKFSENSIIFKNGSKILFLDLSYYPIKDPFFEALGSKEYTGGWIEEAGEVRFEAFDTLKSRIGRHLNIEYGIKKKMLITANPKKGWLKDTFYTPHSKGQLAPEYAFIHALHTDNFGLSQDYRDGLNDIKDVVKRQRLLLGMFDYDDEEGQLISSEKIDDLFTNDHVADEGEWLISSDIALTNDKFVCVVWKGLRIKEISVIANASAPISVRDTATGKTTTVTDWSKLTAEFSRLRAKYGIPVSNIVYDADGIGSNMKTFLSGAVPIHNGGRALSPEYMNLKTQLSFLFAELANAGKIYIEAQLSSDIVERLKKEIGAIIRDSSIGEKLRIKPKSDVKQIIGHSPDIEEAIIYRLLFYITRRK